MWCIRALHRETIHCTPVQENTVNLLRQQRDNPEWNASMLPYWESLPGFGGILTKENMPTDALHLLQDPVLAGTSHTDPSEPPLPSHVLAMWQI